MFDADEWRVFAASAPAALAHVPPHGVFRGAFVRTDVRGPTVPSGRSPELNGRRSGLFGRRFCGAALAARRRRARSRRAARRRRALLCGRPTVRSGAWHRAECAVARHRSEAEPLLLGNARNAQSHAYRSVAEPRAWQAGRAAPGAADAGRAARRPHCRSNCGALRSAVRHYVSTSHCSIDVAVRARQSHAMRCSAAPTSWRSTTWAKTCWSTCCSSPTNWTLTAPPQGEMSDDKHKKKKKKKKKERNTSNQRSSVDCGRACSARPPVHFHQHTHTRTDTRMSSGRGAHGSRGRCYAFWAAYVQCVAANNQNYY